MGLEREDMTHWPSLHSLPSPKEHFHHHIYSSPLVVAMMSMADDSEHNCWPKKIVGTPKVHSLPILLIRKIRNQNISFERFTGHAYGNIYIYIYTRTHNIAYSRCNVTYALLEGPKLSMLSVIIAQLHALDSFFLSLPPETLLRGRWGWEAYGKTIESQGSTTKLNWIELWWAP